MRSTVGSMAKVEREPILQKNGHHSFPRDDSKDSPQYRALTVKNRTYEYTSSESDYGAMPINDVHVKPVASPVRWLVLVVYILLSIINNLFAYSFSPISDITMGYYHIDDTKLNSLALVFMVSGFTTRFGAMWLIDSKGLGTGIQLAAVLNLVGGWFRFYPGYKPECFWALLLGQTICAISQSFIDIAGPKLAANWFPPNQRATATALGQGSIFVAVLLSYASVSHIVTKNSDMPKYLLIEAIIASITAILIFLFFRGSPKVPPSYSAAVGKMPFFLALKTIFRRKNFVLMFLVFSITLGAALALSVLMDEILQPAGYSNAEAGTLATLWIGSAIVGGACGGPIIDKTHAYKAFMVCSISLVTVGSILFTFALEFLEIKSMPIMAACLCLTGLGAAGMPAILEATLETIYPVPEATAMGFLFLGLNITAIIFTLGMEALKNPDTGSYTTSMWIVVVLCVGAIILTLLFESDFRRLEYEKQAAEAQQREEKQDREIS